MSFVPATPEDSASTNTGGLMAIVAGWLADLPRQADTPHRRRAELRRELDAFAWRLVARMDGIDAHDDALPIPDSAGHR
ncbi:MAG: hypothetical protein AB7O80_26045 [Acetobacteraceae bacterium]